ncbi:MAG: putative porin [Bacteroidales bacterium]|nr:putative porin [Bacteroidales bacterium]
MENLRRYLIIAFCLVGIIFPLSDSYAAVNRNYNTAPQKDTLDYRQLDTLYLMELDSVLTCYFDSLALYLPNARDVKKAERKVKKEFKDSVRIATPRILQTFAVPDSLYYERILKWTHDQSFNNLKLEKIDTTFNYHFNDYPFLKKDVNATYLGTSGSATQTYNYFYREKMNVFPFFEPYLIYSYTPETLPQYNTKTPYTELAYWGNLLATKLMEETEIKILTTQNITPSLNFTLLYQRYGSTGMLQSEKTDDRTFSAAINYLGKKYLMNAGYIAQTVTRTENGGIRESTWILDTIVDSKTIDVNLTSASNSLKRRTYFITHSLAIPFNFFRKDADSLALGEGTIAYLGHSGEYSTYTKKYADEISLTDTWGRDFYFNKFNINKTVSADSMSISRLDNKVFLRLQPWASDGIISKIDGGIGYELLSIYGFNPSYYLSGNKNTSQNNLYVYAGASGMFKKYILWEADGKYDYAGYNVNDFHLKGLIRLSIYPFEEGIHLTAKFNTSLSKPNWFTENLYSNHHMWNNDFNKISETKVEGTLDIDKYKLHAFFGYSLVTNMLYYDTLSVVRQHSAPLSIMSAALEKNFKIWKLHFENRVLFQLSSNQDVLPLPTLALNLRYYLEFDVVKNVMRMQIGANALFNTEYYAQAYSPSLGVFYNQIKEKIGNTPYIDAFVNVQWKRACVFVKYTNATKDWPTSDYFSAYHYIRPQTTFKFGIFWPFYVK